MARRVVAGMLALLLGCHGSGGPVLRPVPGQDLQNSTIRIWTHSGNQMVYRASIRGDTLTGSVLSSRGRGEQARIVVPVADIDSLRVMSGQAASPFLVGFAIGAILFWRVLVGGF